MKKFFREKFTSKEQLLREDVERVARIFGYGNVSIDVAPGRGWATRRDGDKITLQIDPEMLAHPPEKDATGTDLPDSVELPRDYTTYACAHEIGHVEDIIDRIERGYESDDIYETSQNPAEHFFHNIIDDSVINQRLKKVPMFRGITNELYENVLFPDDNLSKGPKHVQFMQGWLLDSVTPEREVHVDSDVREALDKLREVALEGSSKSVDLREELARRTTDIARRRELAEKHIYPIYKGFMEEDNQSQDDPDDNQQHSEQNGGAEENYEGYHNAMPCGGHDNHQDHTHNEQDEGSSDNAHESGSVNEALNDLAQAIIDINEEKEQVQAKIGEAAVKNADDESFGIGTLAEELQISDEDAQAYRNVLNTYRAMIQNVGQIFQALTVPSSEYTRPIASKNILDRGHRLAQSRLFDVAIAQHASREPIVWNPVESTKRREGLNFNGVDIHLLVDVSGSMQGRNATVASECSVVLMEGLEAAKRDIIRNNPTANKPDVRLGVILFGSDSKEVVTLSVHPNPVEKGRAFTTIRSADSGSTLVSVALNRVVKARRKFPKRTQVVFLITDGGFGDVYDADDIARSIKDNAYIFQYILGGQGTPITKHVRNIETIHELPKILHKDLLRVSREIH